MNTNDKPWIGTLYYYLISAITVVIMIYGGIAGLLGLYKMVDPVANISSYEYESYSSLDHYTEFGPYARGVTKPIAPGDTSTAQNEPTEEEIEQRWQRYRTMIVDGERREGRQDVIRLGIILIVCLPIFLIHWRFARRAGKANT